MKSAAHPHISFPVLTCLFTLKMRERKALCSLSALQSYQPQEEAPKEPNEMSLVTIWLFWATEEKFPEVSCPSLGRGFPWAPPLFSVDTVKTTVIAADIHSPATKSPKTHKRKWASQQIHPRVGAKASELRMAGWQNSDAFKGVYENKPRCSLQQHIGEHRNKPALNCFFLWRSKTSFRLVFLSLLKTLFYQVGLNTFTQSQLG